MKHFSIKELETFTGIKAHTIRMWEKRHAVFNPGRTTGKNRLYSIEDLKRALQISLLNRTGFRISHLARLTNEKLEELLAGLSRDNERQEKAVNDMVIAMQEVATDRFDKVTTACFAKWPADTVLTKIIYPFLQKIGLLWKGNRLTEEHFVVTAIRAKIIAATENCEVKQQKNKTVLLFLPEKGQMDLSLLYMQYISKKNGCRVLYMGNDISLANLQSVIELKKPDLLFTCLSKPSQLAIEKLMAIMQEFIPAAHLVIATDSRRDKIKTDSPNALLVPYERAIEIVAA